jgi:hypothetical protein
MKITIESTSQITDITDRETGAKVKCRVWEGQTENGVRVHCLIPRIAAHAGQNLSQFEKELQEHKAPSVDTMEAFSLRMII